MENLPKNNNLDTQFAHGGEGRSYPDREQMLRALLDQPAEIAGQEHGYGNYEYAKENGLIDMFYYDPDTGEDALVHVLAGDTIVNENGAVEVAGFHHEPSALHPETYVDHSPLEGKSSRGLRDFRRYPFEPYNAHVVVEGYPKQVLRRDDEGKVSLNREQSSMFPSEYDALAVMQAIRIARDGRNKDNDMPGANNTIITEGYAPALDGQNTIGIKLILDAKTEQVVTAMPQAKRKGIMNLQPDDIQHHLGIE